MKQITRRLGGVGSLYPEILALILWASLALPIGAVERPKTTEFVYTSHLYPLVVNNLETYLAKAILDEQPEFVVVGGDVVEGPRMRVYFSGEKVNHFMRPEPGIGDEVVTAQWSRYAEFIKLLKTEVYLTPGNHDLRKPSDVEHVLRFTGGGDDCYSSVIRDGLLYLFLCTVDTTSSQLKFQLSDRQLEWLEKTIVDTRSDVPLFIFSHHRLWDMSGIADKRVGNTQQWTERVVPLLARFKDVHWFMGDAYNSVPSIERVGNMTRYNVSNTWTSMGYFIVRVSHDADVSRVSIEKRHQLVAGPLPPEKSLVLDGDLAKLKTLHRSLKFWSGLCVGGGLSVFAVLVWLRLRRRRTSLPA